MSVLLELGLYQEALDAGQNVLDALNGNSELDVRPTRRQVDLFTALVYQNRGGCYEYLGRYEDALRAYAVSEERYRTLGMTERLGEILDNKGAVLLYLGRGNEALAAHEAAAAIFADAGLTLSHAKALSNIGEANRQLANYRRSLDAFEQARRLYESLDVHADKGLLLIDTASAYLELNLYAEALASYRNAHTILRNAGMVHDRARALWGAGSSQKKIGRCNVSSPTCVSPTCCSRTQSGRSRTSSKRVGLPSTLRCHICATDLTRDSAACGACKTATTRRRCCSKRQ
jgi:tetratricopeptide (TPR) repeat protein